MKKYEITLSCKTAGKLARLVERNINGGVQKLASDYPLEVGDIITIADFDEAKDYRETPKHRLWTAAMQRATCVPIARGN